MQTLRLRVDWNAGLESRLDASSLESLERAAQILRAGGIVAIPTETVYGLAANALNPVAVGKIFAAKDRPVWDPLIVHIADETMLAQIACQPSSPARKLMSAFWPGPLTLLIPRTPAVPDEVTANRPLVGVRMPSHPIALALIRQAGFPLAAPSANRFGHTSPTTASHVLDDLDGRIDAVLDAGPCSVGLESTVVDTTQFPVVIYRPGAITAAHMQAIGVEAKVFEVPTVAAAASFDPPAHPPPAQAPGLTPGESMVSPGLGLRHYAPRAHLILVDSTGPDPAAKLAAAVASALESFPKQSIGVLLPTDWHLAPPSGSIPASSRMVRFSWAPWHDLDSLAARLFAGLRVLDSAGVQIILCPVPASHGLGAAINDRLRKAAMAP